MGYLYEFVVEFSNTLHYYITTNFKPCSIFAYFQWLLEYEPKFAILDSIT